MLFARGDVAAARAKFDAAARLQGEIFSGLDSRIYLGQIALFYDDRPAEAAAAFAPALKRLFEVHSGAALVSGNDNIYADELIRLVLWQHIARLRAGEDDAQELAANLKLLEEPTMRNWLIYHMMESATDENVLAVTLRRWPGPLLAVYLGKLAPGELPAAAENAGNNAEARRRRACEADFYGGVYLLSKGPRDVARKLLQSAADFCPAGAAEGGFAKAEIARIGT